MKVRATTGQYDGANFHKLVCCDAENSTSGHTNQCPAVSDGHVEIDVTWCARLGSDGSEQGSEVRTQPAPFAFDSVVLTD